MAMLKALLISAFVQVSVAPFPDADSIWESIHKISNINFTFSQSQLTKTFHYSRIPTTCVRLLEDIILLCLFRSLVLLLLRPELLAVPVRSSPLDFALVDCLVRIDELSMAINLANEFSTGDLQSISIDHRNEEGAIEGHSIGQRKLSSLLFNWLGNSFCCLYPSSLLFGDNLRFLINFSFYCDCVQASLFSKLGDTIDEVSVGSYVRFFI